jgi:hypothetical protein
MAAIVITEEALTLIVDKAVRGALERRIEDYVPFPEVAHTCICSDVNSKSKHEADHEIIRRIGRFLDRVENAKWGFLIIVFGAIVSGGLYALWEGIKSVVKK